MLASRFLFGERKDGYTKMIPEGGFSGIAGIIWGVATRTIKGKLKDGRLLEDILRKLKTTAQEEMSFVEESKGNLFCTGPMIVVVYNYGACLFSI